MRVQLFWGFGFRGVCQARGGRVGWAFGGFMKKIQMFYLALLTLCLGVCEQAVAVSAPTSLAELATSVDFSSVAAALFTVAGIVVAVLITIRGIRWLYAFVRR